MNHQDTNERPAKKCRMATRTACKPAAHYMKYTTEYYKKYDPVNPQIVQPVHGRFRSFGAYDNYKLYTHGQIFNLNDIPTSGVRIDDLTISRVINFSQSDTGRSSTLSAKILHKNWPADFDREGMIRATRMPLGYAAKMWVEVGDTDAEGKVVSKGQEGWYYKWWRGLHCLMGKEGFDAGLYLVRPSHESFIVDGFGFKAGYKAVIQAGEQGSWWIEERGEVESGTKDEEIEGGIKDEEVTSGTIDMEVEGRIQDEKIESGTNDEEIESGTNDEEFESETNDMEVEGGIQDEEVKGEVEDEEVKGGVEDENIKERKKTQMIGHDVSTDRIGSRFENETRSLGVYAFAKAMARNSMSRDFGVDAFAKLMARGSASRDSLS